MEGKDQVFVQIKVSATGKLANYELLAQVLKHQVKFPKVFGGHLIFVKITPRKEEESP